MILDCARARPGALGALRLWICGLGMALAAALAGCSSSQNISNGTPAVTVNAQAAGDFSTYVIGVSLYSLTRSDGFVAYPAGYTAEEFANLAQRVDLTELLNAVGLPTGTYNTVTVAVDYSAPIVYVKGQSTLATVQSSDGAQNPGILYVTVKLDPAHPLVLSQNKSTPFALDFDLAASNSVSGNTVTVRPFVVATAAPVDTQPVRARGLFVAGNPGASNFVEDVRPFEDNIYATVGALTVNTTPATFYNINGKVYSGAAGLSAVTGLTSNTPMIAFGTLGDMSTITPGFTATEVYAGTVVSNGVYEHVQGIVSAVNGNTLTVLGATYLYFENYCVSNLCFTYFPTATVNIGPTTVITQDDSTSAVSVQSISVGTQIDAIGVNANPSATALTLDATQGLVRLQSTPIWGTLNSGAPGSASLNLLSLGQFPTSDFSFTGTSANPAAYAVNTGAADESATPAGTLLRADGFPNSFGSPAPDFNATAVTPGTSAPSDLIVEWSGGTGTTAPFTSYDGTSLVLNLANATTAEVVTGPQTTALTGTPAITISGGNQFALGNAAAGVQQFSTASAFASALTGTLNGSTAVFRVVAVGSYDPASNTFTASRVDVPLE